MKKGYVKSMEDAFTNYLADGMPIHEYRYSPEIEDLVKMVGELGGLLIWAHPFQGTKNSIDKLKKVADRLESAGIAGIEMHYDYSYYTKVKKEFIEQGTPILEELIKKNNYLVTCGGDFHDDDPPKGVFGELMLEEKHWLRFLKRLNI